MQAKTQVEDIQAYLNDASNMQGGHASTVFLPESTNEISQILKDAFQTNTPVTISGGRTGTVGGAIPFGGVVISLEKFNKIAIDKVSQTATVGAGVILGDLQKAADAEGLFYPPDPTEWSCQIGGTVATNASGARSFRYGATREYVIGLKIILSDGELVNISRDQIWADENGCLTLTTEGGREINIKAPTYRRPDVRKNVSGYFTRSPLDAIDLFIGSEGSLGVIVEIDLKLLAKPSGFLSGIVFFEKETDLLGFVETGRRISFEHRASNPDHSLINDPNSPSSHHDTRYAIENGPNGAVDINATLIEYFDGEALKLIAGKFPETPEGMAGAIFFEQETVAENEDRLLEQWNVLFERFGADLERSWFTTNEQDREKMRAFRHALPVTVNERIAKYKQRKVGTDMAVPDDKFPSFLSFYKEILSTSGIDHVIFGHIGDCHLHANLLPKNDEEAEIARHIYGRCVAQAIMLGGCVSAEHGIGKLKRKYLAAMMGERYLNEMAELKKAFDPKGILCRGNIFDEKYLAA